MTVVAVTGSSRGLGLAYARELLARGASVVLNGRSASPPALGDASDWTYVAGDVSEREVADTVVAVAQERFGRLDVLINNAGILRDRSLLKMGDEEFDAVIKSHLYGAFYCGRAAATVMRETGSGRILNISSDSATGAFGQSNYAAAKAAMLALTMTWAIELGHYGISVNAVLPNAVTEPVMAVPGLAERWGYRGEFPRSMGDPEEVAPLVAFLAFSEQVKGVTGQIFALGGDRLATWTGVRETAVAFKEGGWSFDDLERLLPPMVSRNLNRPGFEP